MSQYDFQGKKKSEYGSDLFQEYLNEQEAETKPDDKPGLSEQVERDLRNYELFEKRTETRRNKGRKTTVMLVGGIALSAALVITAAGVLISRSTSSGYEEVYPYESYETYEYEEEYQDPYELMGEDISVPEFILDGTYYTLPMPVSALLENGWTVHTSGFGETVTEVGSEPAVIRMDAEYAGDIELTVISPSGETVPLEEATVIGMYIDSWDTGFTLPGYIGIGDGSYYLEDMFRLSDVEWMKTGKGNESTYTVEARDENSAYTIVFNLEDDTTESIMIQNY